MIYKISDFLFEIKTNSSAVKEILKDYESDESFSDFSFSINNEQIYDEIPDAKGSYKRSFLEAVAIQRTVASWIVNNNAFVLHSACFDVDGVGVAFAAHSGTGKTTHMNLWKKLLGNRMIVVNGDKPIVRFFDNEPDIPYAYGTPWNGKEHMGCNMRTKLKHICFIERSQTNYTEKIDKAEIVDRIFNQVYIPKDPVAVMNTMQLIDRLLSQCNLWKIHCNMDIEAAEVAYKTIFSEK